jgi:SAM-dependent methyltransferase
MIHARISDVQSGYDLVAEEYARRLYDELRHKPLDCRLLHRFSDSVRNLGVACDLGCGPGHIARYLHESGIQVCGMDLSAGMIEQARQLNPGIKFNPGDMRALPVEDGTWAGIAAFYAIVNLAPADLVRVLKEMLRVLVPGGRLLLSFHIGEDRLQVEELWGCGAALEFYFFRVGTVAGCIRGAGFEIEEIVEREPYAPDVEYQSRRAYIFAQKPRTKIASV